eukprot:6059959-Alexandrium_andersonii.AAC.1
MRSCPSAVVHAAEPDRCVYLRDREASCDRTDVAVHAQYKRSVCPPPASPPHRVTSATGLT